MVVPQHHNNGKQQQSDTSCFVLFLLLFGFCSLIQILWFLSVMSALRHIGNQVYNNFIYDFIFENEKNTKYLYTIKLPSPPRCSHLWHQLYFIFPLKLIIMALKNNNTSKQCFFFFPKWYQLIVTLEYFALTMCLSVCQFCCRRHLSASLPHPPFRDRLSHPSMWDPNVFAYSQ